jgi:RNA polymerase sigma-70 factor (ECF subfamily)
MAADRRKIPGIKPVQVRSRLKRNSATWDETPLHRVENRKRFEEALLPHLDAAYNLARWLTRAEHDAEDLVQTSYLRALKFFDGYRGTNSRAWLLAIVRNACYTWNQQKRPRGSVISFDEEIHGVDSEATNPETYHLRKDQSVLIRRAIEELPIELREVIVLRELEELSYKEIASIAEIPIGTVMSRLARARDRLRERLGDRRD